MELERFAAVNLVVLSPLVGGPVTAGCEQAMQDGEEDGPLDIELEAARVQEALDDRPAAGLLPEPLEDEGGSDPAGDDGGQLALGVSGEQEDRLGQPGPRGQQGVELAGLLELVEPPERGEDSLPRSAVLPAVL